MRIASLLFVASMLTGFQLFSQCRAEVSGRAVDQKGQPVSEASISFQEQNGGPTHKAIQFFQTDGSGSFHASVDLTHAGSYWVLGKKEDAGYPNTTFAFYEDHEPPVVKLDCGTSIAGLVVKFGSKAAHITRITVLDKRTGTSIPEASIRLKRLSSPIPRFSKDGPTLSTSTVLLPADSSYRGLAVPSNVDVAYEVSAPGYKSSLPKTLHLKPLQAIEVSVALQKSGPSQ